MDNNEALFRLLKAISEGDREAADDAICHLRVGIVAMRELPKVGHSESLAEPITIGGSRHHLWTDHDFSFSYLERTEE